MYQWLKNSLKNHIVLFMLRQGKRSLSLGRFDQAERMFMNLLKIAPRHLQGFIALAQVAQKKNEHPLACVRWKEAVRKFPNNLNLRRNHIRSLLNVLDFEKAEEAYVDLTRLTNDPWHLSVALDILEARYDWPAVLELARSLSVKSPDDLRLRLKEVNIILRYSLLKIDDPIWDQAIEILKELSAKFPFDLKIKTSLANAYIYIHRDKEACQVIESIPKGHEVNLSILELQSWRSQFIGNNIEARWFWKKILKRSILPALSTSDKILKRIDKNHYSGNPGQILLFSVIRNELYRMDWFLNYYRKLGVSWFFVVDNGSDDGTTEFLLQQKDVIVFWTRENFAKTGSGMRWINELIETYGKRHWCLFVDADEALVFPDMEKHDLRHLTRYMERQGHEAMFGFMLDMHAADTLPSLEMRLGGDFLANYPYFNNKYVFYGHSRCPYQLVTGGIRGMFLNTFYLTKTPLIRGGRGIKYLNNHFITPAIISDVTAVLLHFKMTKDFNKRVIEESTRQGRTSNCNRRYASYAKRIQTLEEGHTYINDTTIRYESSAQLVALGLIKSSQEYMIATVKDQ